MKRVFALFLAAAAILAAAATGSASTAAICTPTGFFRDGMNLTAAKINPGNVSGTLDAAPCNIGVYYSPGHSGTVNYANYFGVVNNGGTVNVTNSLVEHIGEDPLNGAQHGVGVYFYTGATGTIGNNSVIFYQNAGIVAAGAGTSAHITGNTVTGLGPVDFIAQNGIEVLSGAWADVNGNSVSGNSYTPGTVVSVGILPYGAANGTTVRNNSVDSNDVGVYALLTGGMRITGNKATNSPWDGIDLDSQSGALVQNNSAVGNQEIGFGLFSVSSSVLYLNNAKNNGSDARPGGGLYVDSGSSGNTMRSNRASGNYPYDCEDDSSGSGTAHTANTWAGNQGNSSLPAGICGQAVYGLSGPFAAPAAAHLRAVSPSS